MILVIFTLFAAYSSKPDNKTGIIEAAESVWADRVPDEKFPLYYEPFIGVTSRFYNGTTRLHTETEFPMVSYG